MSSAFRNFFFLSARITCAITLANPGDEAAVNNIPAARRQMLGSRRNDYYSRLFKLVGALLGDALTKRNATIDRNQRSVSTRPRLGDRRRTASERNPGWLHFMHSALRVRCVFALLFFFTGTIVSPAGEPSLWKLQKLLASKRYVDLTHEFAPGIPRWPGFPNETRKTIYWYDKRPDTMGTSFFSEVFTHVGQWGTHVDPPAHFIKGLRTVDQIRSERNDPVAGGH